MSFSFRCLIAAMLLPFSFMAQKPMIQSSTKTINVHENEVRGKGNWMLDASYAPDIYTLYTKKKKTVTFETGIDSITFKVKPGKNYDFHILLNQKDTCWIQIQAKKETPPVHFTKKYIRKNRGKYSIEIPEVQELVHIIMAITPTGKTDENMVKKTTDYYNDVLAHFDRFRNEPIVAKMNSLLLIPGNYTRIKMDACGFYFDGNQIIKNKTYNRINWSKINHIDPLVNDLLQFSEKTGFREFYKKYSPFYEERKQAMEQASPVQQQWEWLENQFPQRYDNYRITFSPLVHGNHSTNKFMQHDFKQTMMFICGPRHYPDFNKKVNEGIFTRVIFTEIDHNYVNPVSDKYLDEIAKALSNRNVWATPNSPTDGYGSPYALFNEYMTWGVFTLYIMEHFNEEDFENINRIVEKKMMKHRGFKHYHAFNQELIKLYKNKSATDKVPDLYPAILDWCREQNNSN